SGALPSQRPAFAGAICTQPANGIPGREHAAERGRMRSCMDDVLVGAAGLSPEHYRAACTAFPSTTILHWPSPFWRASAGVICASADVVCAWSDVISWRLPSALMSGFGKAATL